MTRWALMGTALLLIMSAGVAADDRSQDFWSTQKKGANGALHRFRPGWFEAAAAAGLQFIRFAPDKLPAAERDFLIGNADHFTTLNTTDLGLLKQILDEAHRNSLHIALVMYSLPGARWSQNNGDVDDYRLWKGDAYQQQAFEFWRQLATELKGHPAIVAYNPLNEPHPAKEMGIEAGDDSFPAWFDESKGTPADLNRFNRGVVAAIRSVDKSTPIILDGYFYADARGMPFLDVIDDPHVLYAFHNIVPWQYAAYRANGGRYSYPDSMPEAWDAPGVAWTKADLAERIEPVSKFMADNGLPPDRIIASEFWCDRRVGGCGEFLADAISLYNDSGWHWSFYEFRSDDDWGGLDYELGATDGLGWRYWQAIENGEDGERHKQRHDNPIWEVIKRELAPPMPR